MRWCKQKFPALAILLGGALVIAAAVALPPGADGWGEDGRWRLPPCTFKFLTGWVLGRQLPCVTCGFTHAFSYAAHGRFSDAFSEQPAGALLFFVVLGLMVNAAWSLWRPGESRPRTHAWKWAVLGGTIGVIAVCGWAYKLWLAFCGF